MPTKTLIGSLAFLDLAWNCNEGGKVVTVRCNEGLKSGRRYRLRDYQSSKNAESREQVATIEKRRKIEDESKSLEKSKKQIFLKKYFTTEGMKYCQE